MSFHNNPSFDHSKVDIEMEANGTNSNQSNAKQSLSVEGGSKLSAHNVNYIVQVSTKCCAKQDKQILTNITGIFKPGMNAILGPTGSGKSSFLDYLAGRLDEKCTSGHLLLDGKPTPENFKCMVGYVVQDDVVMGTLSVKENFAFSAALRLPKSVSSQERNERVEQVIKDLGLKKCADTKVGNEFIRGVSGGERKRCNIGMELIISPPVLFLDEPTTGLDANTANTVLMFLRRISRRGRTIIFSIHQPRYSIYRLFDSLTLLSSGETVFHGPADQALTFFEQQGFQCQEHNNPPDFFLDVINADPVALAGAILDNEINLEDDNKDAAQHNMLVEGYNNSSWNKELQSEASSIMSRFEANGGMQGARAKRVGYSTSFGNQLAVMAGRSMKNVLRNPASSVITIMSSVFFGILILAIFWQLEEDPETGFKDRGGVLFFIILNQIFLNMSAVEIFINERAIFMHENISGFYRVSVYFFVKIIFDLLPLRIIPVFITSLLVYWSVDLRAGSDHFFLFILVLFSVSIAATSLCFLLSSTIHVFSVAQLTLAFCYVLMMLFGNFFINLDSIGVWLSWAQYLSIFKYGQQAMYINEFKDRVFCSNATTCKTGNEYLETQRMDYKDPWDFWQCIMGLLIMAFVFLSLTYVQLRRMKKTK